MVHVVQLTTEPIKLLSIAVHLPFCKKRDGDIVTQALKKAGKVQQTLPGS